ncbi:glycosyltransferase [Luteolibacter marinus]|uniref:glycosyltransferase n=1 Tax=Luteolibacter marinus TaxID=2776705 RepID=UPI001868265D
MNQYYPPDEAPTGLMLEAVAAALVAAGHRVTVLCAEGGYAGKSETLESGTSPPLPSSSSDNTDHRPLTTGHSHAGLQVIRIGATRFGRGTFIGKLGDYASFYLGVAWRLLTLSPKPDRVLVLTTPPYLSVLARILSKLRGADHAHWVMDLYPDVMVAHGMIQEGSIPQRCLAWLTRWGFGGSRSAAIVTLGPDMAERVDRHLHGGKASEWVPLWSSEEGGAEGEGQRAEGESGASMPHAPCPMRSSSLEAEGLELRRERGWEDDELILMYSGNMGLGHRFGEFLAAARELSSASAPCSLPPAPCNRSVRFVFFGGGKRQAEIEQFMAANPGAAVELHDYVPRKQLAAHLRSADVHLASLEPSWRGTMLPSKLQGIFAAARPVIYVGSRESSTARWIGESGGGWVVEPGDSGSLVEVIGAACDPAEARARGAAAARFGLEHFNRDTNAAKLAGLFGRGSR